MPTVAAARRVIDVADLAQLFVCEAEAARPGAPFRLCEAEARRVLRSVGRARLPRNRRVWPLLVACAMGMAHRTEQRLEVRA
jgi:hypothetical protein